MSGLNFLAWPHHDNIFYDLFLVIAIARRGIFKSPFSASVFPQYPLPAGADLE